MDQKAWLYALAASGLIASAVERSQDAEAAPKKKKENVECYGINNCKGENGCGLHGEKARLALKVYPTSYPKTKEKIDKDLPLGECAGTAEGSAKSGTLAWLNKPSKEECIKAGGFVFLTEKDGSYKIEDKDGIKTGDDKKK